jgi:hypothetical protein
MQKVSKGADNKCLYCGTVIAHPAEECSHCADYLDNERGNRNENSGIHNTNRYRSNVNDDPGANRGRL